MSHSGNSNRRMRPMHPNNLPNKKSNPREGEQFYNPSVFRYKCVGYLYLNSDEKGSPGTCRGYQSSLERVANMVPDTREGALKKFLDASADLGTYMDEDNSDQKVKEIYTARTLIYKDDEHDPKKWTGPLIQKAKTDTIAEDELINKTEWSCWGSTSVHYLVLDPIPKMTMTSKSSSQKNKSVDVGEETQKQTEDMLASLKKQLRNLDKNLDEDLAKHQGKDVITKVSSAKVSAITPENIGVSLRKIDSSVGHFTVTDIGSIRICVETSGSTIAPANNNASTADNKLKKGDDKDKNQDHNDKTSIAKNESEEVKPKGSFLDPKNFYAFTLKVGSQMQYNVKELREAVRDDFPGRTYRFGTLVVNRMEKTSKQTFDYMGKILDSWWKNL